MPSEKDKMLAGALYCAADEALVAERIATQRRLQAYNASAPDAHAARKEMLRDLFAAIGSDAQVLPIFACDYGYNIRAGSNLFVNYGCVFLGCAPITIGDDVKIGPLVQLYTPHHPLDPRLRRARLEQASPITIGGNVWIGGGAIICPGVRIGDDAVIGAGTVVTRDVPLGAVVAGNPGRVLEPRIRARS